MKDAARGWSVTLIGSGSDYGAGARDGMNVAAIDAYELGTLLVGVRKRREPSADRMTRLGKARCRGCCAWTQREDRGVLADME